MTDPSPDTPLDPTMLARDHYENFSVLSRLVPERLRDDFAAIYAFCRTADDLADETVHRFDDIADARAESLRLLADFRGQLAATYEGEPPSPAFQALARTVEKHQLPAGPFHKLLDAFEQDQTLVHYQTWDQLLGYCEGSANPVGHLVLMLFGVRPPEEDPANTDRYRLSDAACTALQLANHWQDVRRDLIERDRVYIPAQDTGVTPDQLRAWLDRKDDPEARVPFIKMIRTLTDRTRELFDTAHPLPRTLGHEAGPVVRLLVLGGETILRKVEAIGGTTLWKRPEVSKLDKAALIARVSAEKLLGRYKVDT
ncbi:MAG: squalene synthase HpnC [Planctomycetota bacterium]